MYTPSNILLEKKRTRNLAWFGKSLSLSTDKKKAKGKAKK